MRPPRLLLLMVSLTLAAALPPAHAQAAPGRSVDELLELARNASPQLRAAQMEAAAAMERVQPAGALPDPMLKIELMDLTNMGNSSVQLSPAQVGSTKYTVSQQLPFWGKRDLRREIANAEAQAVGQGAADTWLELSTLIKRSYAQFWQSVNTERLTREIGDLMNRIEKVARSRYAGGLTAQQDVVRAQLELTQIQQELVLLENEQRGVRSMLNGLVSRGPHEPIAEPERLRKVPQPVALEVGALIDRLKAHNPQLAAEASRILGAEKNRELTRLNRMPDFNVGIAPTQQDSRIAEWELMLEMNVPIQFETRRSQERESERMLDAARSREEALTHRIIGELAGAVSALEASRRIESLTETTLLPQSEATFQAALVGYENGRVDFATLLDAQRAIRKARQDVIRARADQQARLADIERLVGEDL
ncbi:TolC family protein [Niveibacterium sp. SC-1]|uniref:TolC family protein n=1 Tax=Niveibacterium sp. SC-1 TaxID=3135646 RepID=UPI00311F0746